MNSIPLRPLAAAALGLATITLAVGGCKTTEYYTYASHPDWPQTVTLKDTRTGEVLWTAEIPVGQKLNVVFSKRADTAEADGSDEMRWAIVPVDESSTKYTNTLTVPPPSGRRLDVEIRKPGEMPPPKD